MKSKSGLKTSDIQVMHIRAKEDLARRRWLVWLPGGRDQLSLTVGGVAAKSDRYYCSYWLDWPKSVVFHLAGCLPRPLIQRWAGHWERKSTFTGRRIRGQRRAGQWQGWGCCVATPPRCSFDLPCRLCPVPQLIHTQPNTQYYLDKLGYIQGRSKVLV